MTIANSDYCPYCYRKRDGYATYVLSPDHGRGYSHDLHKGSPSPKIEASTSADMRMDIGKAILHMEASNSADPRVNIDNDEDLEGFDKASSDIESVPILTPSSSRSFLGWNDDQKGATEEFADLLLNERTLKPLYQKILHRVGIVIFERKFASNLDRFGDDLRTEANNPLELSTVHFVKARKKDIAACIGRQLDPSRDLESRRLRDSITEPSREEKVERYLQRLTEETEDDIELLKHLNSVKRFILGSAALVKLGEALDRFVFQKEKKPGQREERTNAFHLPLEEARDTDKDYLQSSQTKAVESLESEKGRKEHHIPQRHPKPFLNFMGPLLRACKEIAEFLEFSETTLQPGFRRVRWTCFCGSQLYDDFREIETGALDELEKFLNSRTGIKSTTNGSSGPYNQPQNNGATGVAVSQSAQDIHKTPAESISGNSGSNLPPRLRRRNLGHNEVQGDDTLAHRAWILPIFQSTRTRNKVEHLPVNLNISDETLFNMIKARYHAKTSTVGRFLAMRSVKKISCVKFIHAPWEPDIHKFDDWPLRKHSPPWIYKGCPPKHTPLVGHMYLLHLWQNPSHSDLQTYSERPPSAIAKLIRLTRFLRNLVGIFRDSKTDNRRGTDPSTTSVYETQGNVELTATSRPESLTGNVATAPDQEVDRSSYVFLRTPKKVGEQLIAEDENPPEAWGLYIEEGFRVHHLFLVILFVYTLASLAFAIYWCAKYGLVGPRTGSGAFGVSSWMIGLISLIATVWFKWAE